MSKLLTAEFSRLIKTRMFWIDLIAAALLSLYICIVNYNPEIQAASPLCLDDVFFTFHQFLGLFCAAAISLILGTEYSDGTLRNKLIVGHRRSYIFLTDLIVSTASSALVVVVHGIITLCVGSYLFGGFQMPIAQAVYAVVCLVLVAAVFSALCTTISMNCQNKAASAVACLVVVLLLILVGNSLGSALAEAEMTYDEVTITMDGIQYGNLIPNPAYVSGIRRTVYEWLYDLLPTGQATQMFSEDFVRCSHWAPLSVLLFAAISTVGLLCFRQKDIK